MMEEGISTISFYKGEFKPAVEALRAQFALVVASNPWLAGRLVKAKDGICLYTRHPASPSAAEIDALFAATSSGVPAAFKLAPSSGYLKICTDMYASQKVIVGSGSAILAIVCCSEPAVGIQEEDERLCALAAWCIWLLGIFAWCSMHMTASLRQWGGALAAAVCRLL